MIQKWSKATYLNLHQTTAHLKENCLKKSNSVLPFQEGKGVRPWEIWLKVLAKCYLSLASWKIVSQVRKFWMTNSGDMDCICKKSRRCYKSSNTTHIFLRHISTIKSHDREKGGYFVNHKVISYHLQLTRGAQPTGQLSLYLLNDIKSLWREFTKGTIALVVGHF